MASQHDGMVHVAFHNVVFHVFRLHSNVRAPCDAPALYGIRVCANDIRVSYALRSVVVVCNAHNCDGLAVCIPHDVSAYAPHNAAAYALRNAAAYALRSVVFYAHHNMVCALHDVLGNELDLTVFHRCPELAMLKQSPSMSQKLSKIE